LEEKRKAKDSQEEKKRKYQNPLPGMKKEKKKDDLYNLRGRWKKEKDRKKRFAHDWERKKERALAASSSRKGKWGGKSITTGEKR